LIYLQYFTGTRDDYNLLEIYHQISAILRYPVSGAAAKWQASTCSQIKTATSLIGRRGFYLAGTIGRLVTASLF
jgi:hypothetical protein